MGVVAQLVGRFLPTEEVASSSLVHAAMVWNLQAWMLFSSMYDELISHFTQADVAQR